MSLSKKIALVATNATLFLFCLSSMAFAQDQAAEVVEAASQTIDPMRFMAAGVAIGFAALGTGIGQGRAAAGALEGISRNPSAYSKIFMPLIISLALIESLCIYALLIAFFCIFK